VLNAGNDQHCERPDVAPDEVISVCATKLKMGIGAGRTGVSGAISTADIVLHMAVAYRLKGQTDLAIKHFDFAERVITDALLKYPDNAATLLNTRCWIGAVSGEQLESALADCKRALNIQPDMSEVLDSLGFVLYRLDQYADALKVYDGALAKRPDNSGSLYMRGMTKQKLGDNAGAATDIKAATQGTFPVALAYSNYGVKPN
jgi:tetratricopeptide (TPR) repeat protein